MAACDLRATARQLLQRTTIASFLAARPPSHVATLEETTCIGDALAILRRHHILSAPVRYACRMDGVSKQG